MMITRGGTLMRTGVDQISTLSRNTQGVRLIRVEEGDVLVCLASVERMAETEEVAETPPEADVGSDAAPEAPAPDAPTDGA
jgi:DNA gyrase subunit A